MDNEDGAHNIVADLMQGLNDLGFPFAPQAATFWVGEAMSGTDYPGVQHADGVTCILAVISLRRTGNTGQIPIRGTALEEHPHDQEAA